MASAAPSTSPPPGQPPATPASPPNKRDLKSWWRGFKLQSKNQEQPIQSQPEPLPGIFGIPLRQSITYANVAISLIDENGQAYIYGYVPIVVAKCGVFLKEKATDVQGIFRLSGSEKRIKELKTIFDSPDRYGKGLVWEGYTVHDAATVFRRYLNDLPEPVVPLDLYEKFRDPLRGATLQAVGDAEGPQFIENFDEKSAIVKYQKLITELPPLNRQLLLYILDLLAVFAAKAEENRMNSQNLAAIFQPGMLSHPMHAMAPEEYRLNQCVIIFLIENQDHFLIGMQGTATDEQTMQEIENATATATATAAAGAPLTPSRKSGVARSASSASAGADSVRRDGKIRRNRSISSRHSKNEGSVTPNSPSVTAGSSSGLGRSNTVPSKRSPAIVGGKFRNNDSGQHSPARLEPLTQARAQESTNASEKSSVAPAAIGATTLSTGAASAAGRSQEKLLEVPQESTLAATPSKERPLQGLFQRSPTDSSDKRQPNKLRKKRIPGSLNPSAQSSTSSLPPHPGAVSPGLESANTLDSAIPEARQEQPTPQTSAVEYTGNAPPNAPSHALQIQSENPQKNPSTVADAQATTSIPKPVGERPAETPSLIAAQGEKERHTSRIQEESSIVAPTEAASQPRSIGSNEHGDVSNTSLGSGTQRPPKSFTGDSSEPTIGSIDAMTSSDASKDGKDETKGPLGWIRNKYREAKENAEHKRTKSPPGDRQGQTHNLLSRGKSLDMKREQHEEKPAQHVAQPQEAPTAPAPAEPTSVPAPIQAPVQEPAAAPIPFETSEAQEATTEPKLQ